MSHCKEELLSIDATALMSPDVSQSYQGVELLRARRCWSPRQQDGPLRALCPRLGVLGPPGLHIFIHYYRI